MTAWYLSRVPPSSLATSPRHPWTLPALYFGWILGCDEEKPRPQPVTPTESASVPESPAPQRWTVTVRVTLDGVPVAETRVKQGGGRQEWLTDTEGLAVVEVDGTITGDLYVVAAHPEARIDGVEAAEPTSDVLEIPLRRFDTTDNLAYVFADPGPADLSKSNSQQCGHCHITLHEEWYASPHKQSASNPKVHDLYSGTAAAFVSEPDCDQAGGSWAPGTLPGTDTVADRCQLGSGVLTSTPSFGGCADCHAPGIDGVLGGRDLREATGVAYDSGVHCDVCHHVESVDPEAPAGVAGRLRILRPSEPGSLVGAGPWEPLSFGPLLDVLNPRMGAVLREEYHEAELCIGCHELEQAVLVEGASIDLLRWPDGVFPVHSTGSEWREGPMNPAAPCQSCHMPPKPEVGNSADLYNEFEQALVGISAGWERAPGEVRAHSWWGPRQPEGRMLELAASLGIEKTQVGDQLSARVTVKNAAAGHAIPTGEPSRSLVLLVEARCDGVEQPATGGDTIPDFGGWIAQKLRGEDWSLWPGAAVGQRVRVVRRTGDWVDYAGFGAFGDGLFDAAAKGMPVEEAAGEAEIVTVEGDRVSFDRPLPEGDVAWLGEGAGGLADGAPARALAGAAGFAFARVLVGADGERMVPHFLAVDVGSDNRLLPLASWTSAHQFTVACDTPTVHATLLYRAHALRLARERGWSLDERVIAELSR